MMRIFIDLDGVVFDTIHTIVDLYNIDHLYYKNFEPVLPSSVRSWTFDELELEDWEYVNKYFNQPRFFTQLTLINSAKWIINKLHDAGFIITFCSIGTYPNLQLKRQWIQKHFKFAEFIPVDYEMYEDKSHINMSGAILIDDSSINLTTSNADLKICFGEEYPWNEDWKGVRSETWEDVYSLIKNYKGENDE